MNKITNLFGILLIVTLSACANSKTAADAPNSTDTNHSPQVKMASEMSREVYQRIGEHEATKECLW